MPRICCSSHSQSELVSYMNHWQDTVTKKISHRCRIFLQRHQCWILGSDLFERVSRAKWASCWKVFHYRPHKARHEQVVCDSCMEIAPGLLWRSAAVQQGGHFDRLQPVVSETPTFLRNSTAERRNTGQNRSVGTGARPLLPTSTSKTRSFLLTRMGGGSTSSLSASSTA